MSGKPVLSRKSREVIVSSDDDSDEVIYDDTSDEEDASDSQSDVEYVMDTVLIQNRQEIITQELVTVETDSDDPSTTRTTRNVQEVRDSDEVIHHERVTSGHGVNREISDDEIMEGFEIVDEAEVTLRKEVTEELVKSDDSLFHTVKSEVNLFHTVKSEVNLFHTMKTDVPETPQAEAETPDPPEVIEEEEEEEFGENIQALGGILATFTALSFFVGVLCTTAPSLFGLLLTTRTKFLLNRMAVTGFIFTAFHPIAIFIGLNGIALDISKSAIQSLKNGAREIVILGQHLAHHIFHYNQDAKAKTQGQQLTSIQRLNKSILTGVTIVIVAVYSLTKIFLVVSIVFLILTIVIYLIIQAPLTFIFGAIYSLSVSLTLELLGGEEESVLSRALYFLAVCTIGGLLNNLGGSPIYFAIDSAVCAGLFAVIYTGVSLTLEETLQEYENLKKRAGPFAVGLLLFSFVMGIIQFDPLIFPVGLIYGASCTFIITSLSNLLMFTVLGSFVLFGTSGSLLIFALASCVGSGVSAVLRADGGLSVRARWQDLGSRVWRAEGEVGKGLQYFWEELKVGAQNSGKLKN